MPTPHRGLLAGLLALVLFAAGAVAMAAHAPSAAVPTAGGATAQPRDDGHHGRGFVGFRDER
jgi:Spy/CpxP family protein refolding chaperone